MRFTHVDEAADHLSARLASQGLPSVPVVLAVGDESLPLADAIARRLGAPAATAPPVTRLVLPWYPRLAFGALTADNHHYVDPVVAGDHSLGAREIAQLCRQLLPDLRLARWAFPHALGSHTAVVVSRGLTTGYRALALAASARAAGATRVLIAAPCAAADTLPRIGDTAHAVVLHPSDAARFDPDECWEREAG